jgi:transcriptional regulator EpsA
MRLLTMTGAAGIAHRRGGIGWVLARHGRVRDRVACSALEKRSDGGNKGEVDRYGDSRQQAGSIAGQSNALAMTFTSTMDRFDGERILHVIEESIKVTRRFQFFLWARGALQGLLPHDVLVCASGDLAAGQISCDTFSSGEEAREVIERLIAPVDGLLVRIIGAWEQAGREPLCISDDEDVVDPLAVELRRLGCHRALGHGAREVINDHGSFFLFLQMPSAPSVDQAYWIDLVMPHLHMALHRMLLWENDAQANHGNGDGLLSGREAEVLRWVGQGKTNQEIGDLLDISPRTVKNHVQNILRKLGVSNRAQAVLKGHVAHLIGAEGNWHGGGAVVPLVEGLGEEPCSS